MRIAYTTDTYWPRINGVSVSTQLFMDELIKNGHDVRLWAPTYPMTKAERAMPVAVVARVHRMKSFSVLVSKEDYISSPFEMKRFWSELDQFEPDLIHCQTEFSLSWFSIPYAKRRGIPVVMTCHTYFEKYVNFFFPLIPAGFAKWAARSFAWLMFRKAKTIVVPTRAMKIVLESYGLSSNIQVIPTGIEPSDFSGVDKASERESGEFLRRHPQLIGKKLLLAVGRMGQEKNVDFLLDVVKRLQPDLPGTTLLVAGNGPYMEQFQRNIVSMGLSDLVLPLGYVKRSELKHLYALADVFTFASVTETQGLVTIESMMCRTPVVAIGKMGTLEVMEGDNGGFMVGENVAEFTLRVHQLLTDPVLYAQKSQEAWDYSQNWTSARMAARLETLYRSLVRQV